MTDADSGCGWKNAERNNCSYINNKTKYTYHYFGYLNCATKACFFRSITVLLYLNPDYKYRLFSLPHNKKKMNWKPSSGRSQEKEMSHVFVAHSF